MCGTTSMKRTRSNQYFFPPQMKPNSKIEITPFLLCREHKSQNMVS